MNYQKLVKANDYTGATEIVSDSMLFQTRDEWEHINGSYLFDSIMLAAKEHSAFLIDLSGDVSILRTEENIGGSSYSDVITNVEGIDGEVRFRMEQAPSGRWRVHQVIILDGDEDQIPWSVPTEEE